MIKLNTLNENMTEEFEFVALVTELNTRLTKTGKDFLEFTVTTKEAKKSCKKWGPLTKEDKAIKVGDVISATGKVNMYNGNMSIVVSTIKVVPLDKDEFTLSTIEPKDALEEEFAGYIDMVQDSQLKTVLLHLMQEPDVKEEFFLHPAAKSCHHAFEGGLLYHTTRMLRMATNLCDNVLSCNDKKPLNKDLVIAGIIFHDIGKLQEMDRTDVGNGDYTVTGCLVGHIALGFERISKYEWMGMLDSNIALNLKHIVLSHHGKLEFGSPIKPATREAVLVNFVDGLDAKMNAVEGDLLMLAPGEISKDPNYGLDGTRVYNPVF